MRSGKEFEFEGAAGGGGAVALPRGLGLESVGLEPGGVGVTVSGAELESASRFIIDSTLSTINTIISDKNKDKDMKSPSPTESQMMNPQSPVKVEGQQKLGVRTRSRTRSNSGGASASGAGVGNPMDMDRKIGRASCRERV